MADGICDACHEAEATVDVTTKPRFEDAEREVCEPCADEDWWGFMGPWQYERREYDDGDR